jgi:hypothetical protein
MSDFDADWLALREPADRAARSRDLTHMITTRLAPGLRVVDLGAGSGANFRYLTVELRSPQHWLLVDRDPRLLTIAAIDRGPSTAVIEIRLADLNDLRDEWFDAADLVTASALLDLVSENWLTDLAARCRQSAAAVLFALSYDGRIECQPDDPADDEIFRLVNRHQRTDKGFGPALGPEAARAAAAAFSAVGYQIRSAPSDWLIDRAGQALQRRLLEGWARAAVDVVPDRHVFVSQWLARRLAHVDAGTSRVRVGHQDLVGWIGPPAGRF